MNNKVILSFLIIPVIIACQNNNVNVSSSPSPSKSNNIIPTTNPTTTISPTATPTVDTNITSIIESNMIDTNLFYSYLNFSLPTIPENYMKDLKEIKGIVYDRNKKIISNATVTATNTKTENIKYQYEFITKTNENGEYTLLIPSNNEFIDLGTLKLEAKKENYTSRFFTIGLKVYFYTLDRYKTNVSFGDRNSIENLDTGTLGENPSINLNPEIKKLTLNNISINAYSIINGLRNSIEDIERDKIKKDVTLPRFKIKTTDKLKIEFKFNNSIKKESIEKNLIIKSLDSNIEYNFDTVKSSFKWSNDDKDLIFECPIIANDKNIKYILYFKEPFIDSNLNKAYPNEYISLNSFAFNELSENIVFEIAGSK